MAKMTIAQLREREVLRLAYYHAENPTEEDIRTAKRLMNSYYRLVGLCERVLYLSNDERTCNSRYLSELEDKEDKWYHRLSKQFAEFCGCRLRYFSYFPSIIDEYDSLAISLYFYSE